MGEPNRWLHLRHADGFDEHRFTAFRAHCETWTAYARAVLANWASLPLMSGEAPKYEFFEPQLSEDRRVATLPLGGERTLVSRSSLEDGGSRLLWQYFTVDFLKDLEEGITENFGQGQHTTWRAALRPAQQPVAADDAGAARRPRR